jgi:hypothetical protein
MSRLLDPQYLTQWRLYDVQHPILHPVPARAGDVIAVRRRRGDAVVVLRRRHDGWAVVATGPNDYEALLAREDDGVIERIFASALGPQAGTVQRQSA